MLHIFWQEPMDHISLLLFLLDPKSYYTTPGIRHKRYRVKDNSLGPVSFSPIVRKTEFLEEISKIDFKTRIKSIISSYDFELYNRSIRYLYGKETKASFDIERETPTQQRFTRFVRVLKHAGENELTKERLRDIQNILEYVSDPLMQLIEFETDRRSRVHVKNETADFYRYIDYTPIAEYLVRVIEKSVEENIPKELSYLLKLDKFERAVKDIVDLPDQSLSLLLSLVTQNNGKLSMKKRKNFFSELSPSLLDEIETAYGETMKWE